MKWIGILIAFVVFLAAALYFFPHPAGDGTVATSTDSTASREYESANYAISFRYPATYTVRETNASKGGQEIYRILVADTQALENVPPAGEGPTAITIDIYGDVDATSTESWIRTSSVSNFQLSTDGRLSSTTLAGESALEYTWDGLYRGRSIAFMHEGDIIVASVTMLESTDKIVSDFNTLIRTIELE